MYGRILSITMYFFFVFACELCLFQYSLRVACTLAHTAVRYSLASFQPFRQTFPRNIIGMFTDTKDVPL